MLVQTHSATHTTVYMSSRISFEQLDLPDTLPDIDPPTLLDTHNCIDQTTLLEKYSTIGSLTDPDMYSWINQPHICCVNHPLLNV